MWFNRHHKAPSCCVSPTTILRLQVTVLLLVATTILHPTPVTALYTLEDVALHNSPSDCWSSIYDKIWDLTVYAPQHPKSGGGSDSVYLLCGIDGTSTYESFHGNHPEWLEQFEGIEFKGERGTPTTTSSPNPTQAPTTVLPTTISSPTTDSPTTVSPTTISPTTASPTTSPTSQSPTFSPTTASPTMIATTTSTISPTSSSTTTTTTITLRELSRHNSLSGCYMSLFGPIYDFTSFLKLHPGGQDRLLPHCGTDGTLFYTRQHSNESILERFGADYSLGGGVLLDNRTVTTTQLANHSTLSDCWIVYDGTEVYNVTKYYHNNYQNLVNDSTLFWECGNANGQFNDSTIMARLPGFQSCYVGALIVSDNDNNDFDFHYYDNTNQTLFPLGPVMNAEVSEQTESPTIEQTQPLIVTTGELAQHSNPDDCWVSYFSEVYDVTEYAPNHPAGAGFVTDYCGEDGTKDFSVFHDYGVLEDIWQYYKGMLQESSSSSSSSSSGQSETEVPTVEPTEPASVTEAELAQHNNRDDCWVSYFSEVYDVTEYAPNHPGGAGFVLANCGEDGTEDFSVFHDYSELEDIWPYYKGMLSSASDVSDTELTMPEPEPTESPDSRIVTQEELSQHNRRSDCWVSYFSEVYDVTEYAPTHPGGASLLTGNCGKDDTESFAIFHEHEQLEEIKQYFKGMLGEVSSQGEQPQQQDSDEEEQDGEEEENDDEIIPAPNAETEEQSSQAQKPLTSTTSVAPSSTIPALDNGMIHLTELEKHATPDDCWVAYYNEVYDMTSYAPEHPGDSITITVNCGEDGTKQYEAFHERSLLALVKQYYMGELDTTTIQQTADTDPPKTQGPVALTWDELAAHDNPGSCYVKYYDDIYDLTLYSHPSPPGQSVIYLGCGRDSTQDFAQAHPRALLNQVESYKVGWIESDLFSSATRVARTSPTFFGLLFACTGALLA